MSSTRPHRPSFSQKEQYLVNVISAQTYNFVGHTFIWCIAHKSSLFVYLQIKKQDQPTFPLLIDFPASAGGESLNVLKEIGTHYNMFGVLLLNDKTGATISALEQQHQCRATAINYEILQQWIRGSGKKPVTWETLVKVLRQIELNTLADKIESSLS